MKIQHLQKVPYRDALAEKRRQQVKLKSAALLLVALALLGGLGYFLIFAPYFQVSSVEAEGFSSDHTKAILDLVGDQISRRFVFLPIGRSSLFIHGGSLAEEITATLPFVQEVTVEKPSHRSLKVIGKERKTIGTWCFKEDCFLFDKEGKILEKSSRSSGYLLLAVRDEKNNVSGVGNIDRKYFGPVFEINSIINNLGMKTKEILIPQRPENEIQVSTSKYGSVLFSLDFSITEQGKILGIFLADKERDPTFNPQRLDLRIKGRVYYK